MTERRRRHGPAPLPQEQRRTHCVSVRLSPAELADLDAKRGAFQRGEWLRMAAMDQLPPSIPAINGTAWSELARAAGNLNQIARVCNSDETVDIEALRRDLAEFRRSLIGAKP